MFLSVVLDRVFCVKGDLLIGDCDRDATRRLLVHKAIKGRILEIP